jgi:hypothetical protein
MSWLSSGGHAADAVRVVNAAHPSEVSCPLLGQPFPQSVNRAFGQSALVRYASVTMRLKLIPPGSNTADTLGNGERQ